MVLWLYGCIVKWPIANSQWPMVNGQIER